MRFRKKRSGQGLQAALFAEQKGPQSGLATRAARFSTLPNRPSLFVVIVVIIIERIEDGDGLVLAAVKVFEAVLDHL